MTPQHRENTSQATSQPTTKRFMLWLGGGLVFAVVVGVVVFQVASAPAHVTTDAGPVISSQVNSARQAPEHQEVPATSEARSLAEAEQPHHYAVEGSGENYPSSQPSNSGAGLVGTQQAAPSAGANTGGGQGQAGQTQSNNGQPNNAQSNAGQANPALPGSGQGNPGQGNNSNNWSGATSNRLGPTPTPDAPLAQPTGQVTSTADQPSSTPADPSTEPSTPAEDEPRDPSPTGVIEEPEIPLVPENTEFPSPRSNPPAEDAGPSEPLPEDPQSEAPATSAASGEGASTNAS